MQDLLRAASSGCDRLLVVELYFQGDGPTYVALAWGLDEGRSILIWRDGHSPEVKELTAGQRLAFAKLLDDLPSAGVREGAGRDAYDGYAVRVTGRIKGKTHGGSKLNPRIPIDPDEEIDRQVEKDDYWYDRFFRWVGTVGSDPFERDEPGVREHPQQTAAVRTGNLSSPGPGSPFAGLGGHFGGDPAAAKAFLKELVDPAPLVPGVRLRVGKLLADLGSENWKPRDAALRELVRIGPKVGPLTREAMKTFSPEAAARAQRLLQTFKELAESRATFVNEAIDLLAGRKDRAVLDSLVALLGHQDRNIRRAAEYGVRRLTGMRFGYNADASANQRCAAAAKWATWWKAAREEFDFAPAGNGQRVAGVLAWDLSTPEAVLVGLHGKVIWSRQLPKPSCCADALSNGNILINRYDVESDQTVLEEYGPKGEMVWTTDGLELARDVHGAERLMNGNTLVVDRPNGRLLEIGFWGRRIAWQHEFGHRRLCAAQRLSNGNTLLCFFEGELQEINRAGKVVWSKADLRLTNDAQKLPNGNLLIVDFSGSRVVQLDKNGRGVWSWTSDRTGRPISARRLPNQRTVVQTSRGGLIMIDPTGENAKRLDTGKVRLTCYPQIRLAPAGAARSAKAP